MNSFIISVIIFLIFSIIAYYIYNSYLKNDKNKFNTNDEFNILLNFKR